MANIIPTLAIVMPCYNEGKVLKKTLTRVSQELEKLSFGRKISAKSFIMCVDDGSLDDTWKIISAIENRKILVKGIKLSHNSGHQNALIAGMFCAKVEADCVITMDADLQHDPSAIANFVSEFTKGNDIVYGVRKERKGESFTKRITAQSFYKFMHLLGVDVIFNHADYRLVSKRVIECLEQFNETELFLRGIFPTLGFKSEVIYYSQNERVGGESKYPLKKMISFALNGITAFSIKPLRIIATTGFVIFIASLIAAVWVLIDYLIGRAVHGWPSTVLPIYFIGGIQLLSLGIIGEYLGRIYQETKRRPRYFIEETTYEK